MFDCFLYSRNAFVTTMNTKITDYWLDNISDISSLMQQKLLSIMSLERIFLSIFDFICKFSTLLWNNEWRIIGKVQPGIKTRSPDCQSPMLTTKVSLCQIDWLKFIKTTSFIIVVMTFHYLISLGSNMYISFEWA